MAALHMDNIQKPAPDYVFGEVMQPCESQLNKTTHVTEDHGLAYGDGAVDVGECLELCVLAGAFNEVLFDVDECLLFSPQSDHDSIWHDVLGELHHFSVVCRREQQHLAAFDKAPVEETRYRLMG